MTKCSDVIADDSVHDITWSSGLSGLGEAIWPFSPGDPLVKLDQADLDETTVGLPASPAVVDNEHVM